MKAIDHTAIRATFDIRDDGLYCRFDGGKWLRMARKSMLLNVAFDGEALHVRTTIAPKPRSPEPHDAVNAIRNHLANRDGIIDTVNRPLGLLIKSEFEAAGGFFVRIPGIGKAFAVKHETLAGWICGRASLLQVIRHMAAEGFTIAGADGNRTRQIKIGNFGRHRYYCFKTNATLTEPEPRTEKLPAPPAIVRNVKYPKPIADDSNWGNG